MRTHGRGVGAVRLYDPGDCFTVRFATLPTNEDAKVVIGIAPLYQKTNNNNAAVAARISSVAVWLKPAASSTDKVMVITDVRSKGSRPWWPPTVYAGNELTLRLVPRRGSSGGGSASSSSSSKRLLAVSVELKDGRLSGVVCETPIPEKDKPPYLPTCTLCAGTTLDMVHAVGTALWPFK